MDKIKLLENLLDKLNTFGAEGFSDDEKEFNKFIYQWAKTKELIEKVYLSVKDKFPDNHVVKWAKDEIEGDWNLPLPAYEDRYDYAM